MQVQQLRYVVAVAEERHFTRAAARLHVAQPSLSNQVRALETELGAPLFDRSRRRVVLTPAGEAFLPWARQALADCEAGREVVRELLGLQRGRLSIGATPSLTTGLLPTLLADFHERYPGVELRLRQAGSRELVDSVDAGELDLALVILPVRSPRVTARALAEDELVLAVAETHPLAHRTSIAITDLRGVPLVGFREGYDLRETTFEACRSAGFEPTLALEGGEMDGVLALAEAGLGGAVVPMTALGSTTALRAIRFGRGMPRRTVGLARCTDRPQSQAAAAFERAVLSALTADGS
ncbi:MAG TPA: LysR substrate-binding domain-containing protein [Mycobacteriales bacterium]|nr:LysR substrate-binding domain-containing protein [Mycobacteriales bacterium]